MNANHAPAPSWPAETNLVFVKDKLLLTRQHREVRAVIHNSFDRVRAALVFHHGFPDFSEASKFIKDALVIVAEGRQPGAAAILTRLRYDQEYADNMSTLVSLTIFRGCLD